MTLFDIAPAIISDDIVIGPYRYKLSREWNPSRPHACWAMLNPSKATRERRDPTDKKVEKFTRAWGFGGYTIVNLAALQATDPDELALAEDPVGPGNPEHFWEAVAAGDLVVAAWGASYPKSLASYVAHIAHRMRDLYEPQVLGLTKDGDPRHPLYMPDATVLTRWEAA